MEQCLTELEDRPQDAELLAGIFRSVHTIKGTTGFLGYSRLESLSHAGENLLGLLRDGKLAASAEIISALLELMDGLRAILQSIEATGDEGQGGDVAMIERLLALAETAPSASGRPNPAPPGKQEMDDSRSAAPSNAADSTLRVDIA